MNLLAYTKKLYEKISFYDKAFNRKNFDVNVTNPFARPLNVTVIWIEKDKY